MGYLIPHLIHRGKTIRVYHSNSTFGDHGYVVQGLCLDDVISYLGSAYDSSVKKVLSKCHTPVYRLKGGESVRIVNADVFKRLGECLTGARSRDSRKMAISNLAHHVCSARVEVLCKFVGDHHAGA